MNTFQWKDRQSGWIEERDDLEECSQTEVYQSIFDSYWDEATNETTLKCYSMRYREATPEEGVLMEVVWGLAQ